MIGIASVRKFLDIVGHVGDATPQSVFDFYPASVRAYDLSQTAITSYGQRSPRASDHNLQQQDRHHALHVDVQREYLLVLEFAPQLHSHGCLVRHNGDFLRF